MPRVGLIQAGMLHLLALTAIGTAGCGSDSTGPEPASITGEYKLVQVRTSANSGLSGGGDTLPVTFVFDAKGQTVTFSEGGLILDDDGNYSWFYLYTQMGTNDDGEFLIGNDGTYVRNGNSIAFTRSAGPSTDSFVGTINDAKITLDIRHGDFLFQQDFEPGKCCGN